MVTQKLLLIQQFNSYMNKQLQGHLINFFRELMQSQKTLQCIRRQLSQLKNFHPMCIFKTIAGSNQTITIKLMTQFVEGKIACNEKDMYDIFEKFDHKRRGYIDKQDFCRELQPTKKKASKKTNFKKASFEIQSKFLYYLSTIIKSSRVIDVWRKEISIIEPYKIFEVLDISLDGRIGPKDIAAFFYKSSQKLNAQGSRFLYQIMLRRHYNEVNLEVFCQNLNPRQFGGYPRYQRQKKTLFEYQLTQNLKRQQQAAQAQKNFYKQLHNQKVVSLVHRQACLQRQKELQDRIKDEIEVYQDLKYLTRKKYHPNLTYEEFLIMEKQNTERANLQNRLILQEEKRKQAEYRSRLNHVDAVRELQLYNRSKVSRNSFIMNKA